MTEQESGGTTASYVSYKLDKDRKEHKVSDTPIHHFSVSVQQECVVDSGSLRLCEAAARVICHRRGVVFVKIHDYPRS